MQHAKAIPTKKKTKKKTPCKRTSADFQGKKKENRLVNALSGTNRQRKTKRLANFKLSLKAPHKHIGKGACNYAANQLIEKGYLKVRSATIF